MGLRDVASGAFPPGTLRGRVVRDLAATVGLAQGSAFDQKLNFYAQHLEPHLFGPVVRCERPADHPLFSVVVPFFNTPDRYLRPLLDSLASQSFGQWELLMGDASTEPDRVAAIERASRTDPRFRYRRLATNGGISANTNALLPAARGDYLVFCDHDDLLSLDALNENARCVLADPGIDILYSDEDVISDDGRVRHTPFFKAAWSPHMFLECNYTNHLSVIRRSLVEAVGGLRSDFDGAQDYDLLLRLHTLPDPVRVAHIPKVLYHWRQAEHSTARQMGTKPYALQAGSRALGEYLARLGVDCAGVTDQPGRPGWYHVQPRCRATACVVVAVSDDADLNARFADLIRARTDGHDVTASFVVVPHREARAELADLAGEADLVVAVAEPYVPRSPEWLDECAGVLGLPAVDIVAPLLVRSTGEAIDAGLMRDDVGSGLMPLYAGMPAAAGGPAGPADMVRDVDGLNGAVVAVRRENCGLLAGDGPVTPGAGYAVLWAHQRFIRVEFPRRDGFLNANLALDGAAVTLRQGWWEQ